MFVLKKYFGVTVHNAIGLGQYDMLTKSAPLKLLYAYKFDTRSQDDTELSCCGPADI